jgi:hypothetical protein
VTRVRLKKVKEREMSKDGKGGEDETRVVGGISKRFFSALGRILSQERTQRDLS